MRLLLRLIPLALASAGVAMPALGDTAHATTPRGEPVDVVADFPAGAGPFPAVVLAPGQGYHLALPALAQTAQQLVAHGIAVYRFNWAYFSSNPKAGRPSDDLSAELEDLQSVLKMARTEPRVAQDKVSVGGKSLGSLVAWKALSADPSLRAGVLLTPVCSRASGGETQDFSDTNYPGITTERRPLLFIAGDRDPLCTPRVLYAFAARSQGSAHVAIIGGDHGFENKTLGGPAAVDAARNRNINLVSLLSASFIVENAGH